MKTTKRDSLGDRMKRYEDNSKLFLMRRVPVLIRLDGRAFHTLTRNVKKPFESFLMDAMSESALSVAKQIQGAKVIYTQSDEVSILLTDYDSITQEPWFGYNQQKLVSISAAVMSVKFNKLYPNDLDAVFDSRAFNVPKDDVINIFLWRAKDWNRNSLQMYCRSNFTHKQLQGKKRDDMHEMLHAKGLNWTTDLSGRERNGRYFVIGDDGKWHVNDDVLPTYQSVECIMKKFL